eukprot:GGOE01011791.1.p5 GENE.GGOE01011791.1~~GGOE01011791.1.p5  ORF type:complete len:113 (-),score=1.56 GGOE01011791.1:1074-1412(-)
MIGPALEQLPPPSLLPSPFSHQFRFPLHPAASSPVVCVCRCSAFLHLLPPWFPRRYILAIRKPGSVHTLPRIAQCGAVTTAYHTHVPRPSSPTLWSVDPFAPRPTQTSNDSV